MRKTCNFSQGRLLPNAFSGWLAAVALIAATATQAAGQQRVNPSYLLSLDTGWPWQTKLHVVNVDEQKIRLAVKTRDQFGALLVPSFAPWGLERGAARSMKLDRDFQGLPGTFEIESHGNYLAAAVLQNLENKKLEVIQAIPETSRLLAFPLLFAGDYRFKKLAVINVEPVAANLEISALAKDGSELQRVFLPPLKSLAKQTLDVVQLFDAYTLKEMTAIRITSDRLLAGLQVVDPADRDVIALPALIASGPEWYFPVHTGRHDHDLWTRVGLFNTAERNSSITIEAFDSANYSLGVIDRPTLLSGATYQLFTEEAETRIPEEAAYLKVTADEMISGWQVIGVGKTGGIAAALAIAAADQNALGFEVIGSTDGAGLAVSRIFRGNEGSIRSQIDQVGAAEWRQILSLPDSPAVLHQDATDSPDRLQRAANNYGDQRWIPVGSRIPADWVILDIVANQYRTQYVGGASFGATVNVILSSPVPANWVINYQDTSRRILKYAGGAGFGVTLTVILSSPVPANWVINNQDALRRYLQYAGGATFGARLTVIQSSPVPANWVINAEDAMNRYLQYAGGATFGVRLTVTLGSPVPANWVITSQDALRRYLEYVGGASFGAIVSVIQSSPVPADWVIISEGSTRLLKYVGGAPQGTIVTVTLSSPIPAGWQIIRSSPASRDLMKL